MSGNHYTTYAPYERQSSFERHANRGFLHSVEGDEDETRRADDSAYSSIGPEPSLDFSRKTWWDNLLNVYSHSREAS